MAHREVRADVDARDRQEGRGQGRARPGPFHPEFDPETNAIRFGWDADDKAGRRAFMPSGLRLFWWAQQDSNLQPGDYESLALTVAP